MKRFFEENPLIEKIGTSPDGNIYSLGNYDLCYHCYYSQRVWYNKTWLDKLGLEVPQTTDELYAVLTAFKTQDPNGNGKADEVPFTGATTGWNTTLDGYLMNPFEYNDARDRLYLDGGTVVAAFTTDGWRDGLRWINRLYAEGLIDQEGFTQDQNQMKQGVEGETILYGAIAAGVPAAFSLNEGEATRNFHLLPPVAGPSGLRRTPFFPPEHGFRNGRFVITREAEHPEVAFRWADYMYAEEATLTLYFGEQGVDWKYSEPGEVGVDDEPALFEELTMVRGVPGQNQAWSHMSPRHASWAIIQSRTTNPDDIWYIEKRLYDATKSGQEPYGAPRGNGPAAAVRVADRPAGVQRAAHHHQRVRAREHRPVRDRQAGSGERLGRLPGGAGQDRHRPLPGTGAGHLRPRLPVGGAGHSCKILSRPARGGDSLALPVPQLVPGELAKRHGRVACPAERAEMPEAGDVPNGATGRASSSCAERPARLDEQPLPRPGAGAFCSGRGATGGATGAVGPRSWSTRSASRTLLHYGWDATRGLTCKISSFRQLDCRV